MTMVYYNQLLALIFVVLMALAYVYYSVTQHHRDASSDNVIAGTVV